MMTTFKISSPQLTPKQIVLISYRNAKSVAQVECGFSIYDGTTYLGSGQTAAKAWKNAYDLITETEDPIEVKGKFYNAKHLSKRQARIADKIANNTYRQKTQKESRNILYRAIG